MIGIEKLPATIREMVIATNLMEYFDGDKAGELAHLAATTHSGNVYDFGFIPGSVQTVRHGGVKFWLRPANAYSNAGGEGGYIGFDPDTHALLIAKRDDDGVLAPTRQSSPVRAFEVLAA